jgi:branched-chain amino acid transport system substrate-binding protein
MRMRFGKIFLVAAFCFVVFGVGAVHGAETVKIGWYGPTSGSSAQDGQDGRIGAEIARDLTNAEGGINGRLVEIVFEDDKSDPKEGANIATKFANDKSIIGVVGPYNSSVTLAAAPIFNRNKLCDVAWAPSSPMITEAGDYIYRVQYTDSVGADFLARWIVQEDGYKKVAIVYENTDYGLGILNVGKESIAKYGGEVVAEASYMSGQTKDFSSIITSVKAAKPDVVLLGSLYNEGALFAVQAKSLAFDVPLYGNDSLFSDGLIEIGGKAVEGLRCFGGFFPDLDTPAVKKLAAAYKEKTGKDKPNNWVALSYDATMSVIEAMKKTDAKSREDVKKGLDSFEPYDGATGTFVFDENGDVQKELVKHIVKDGEFEAYKK